MMADYHVVHRHAFTWVIVLIIVKSVTLHGLTIMGGTIEATSIKSNVI